MHFASPCFSESFWTNPQYHIKVAKKDLEKKEEKNILVSLMQKPDKRNRRLVKTLHIGIAVYEVTLVYYTKIYINIYTV